MSDAVERIFESIQRDPAHAKELLLSPFHILSDTELKELLTSHGLTGPKVGGGWIE